MFRPALLALSLLALLTTVRADEKPEAAWSPIVHGLRARLFVTPSHDPMVDKTFDIWIEFQETGLETSLGLEHRSLTVRFSRAELQVAIAPAKGNPIAVTPRTDDAPVFSWDLIFPPSGQLSFPIGTGGSRPHMIPGQTPPKGRLLSFDSRNEWTVPIDGGPFELAITLNVPADGEVPAGGAPAGATAASGAATNSPSATSGPTTNAAVSSSMPDSIPPRIDADAAHKPPYRGWSGTLVLPPIDLPAQ